MKYIDFKKDPNIKSTIPLFSNQLFPSDTKVITNGRISLFYQPMNTVNHPTLINQ